MATLAGMSLEEGAPILLARDLSELLKRLDELPEGVFFPRNLEPLIEQGAGVSALREDVPNPAGPELRAALLEAAPVRQGEFFALPQILER